VAAPGVIVGDDDDDGRFAREPREGVDARNDAVDGGAHRGVEPYVSRDKCEVL
jgi:hypothetical protein